VISPNRRAAGASVITLELRHKRNNPRNSEGAFITLADGRILFAYSRYYGSSWSDDDHHRDGLRNGAGLEVLRVQDAAGESSRQAQQHSAPDRSHGSHPLLHRVCPVARPSACGWQSRRCSEPPLPRPSGAAANPLRAPRRD